MDDLFYNTKMDYITKLSDKDFEAFNKKYPNEQREILANYLNSQKANFTDPGQLKSIDEDVQTLMNESKDLRQNKVKNRIQQFKDAYGYPNMNDVEFENFMNSSTSDKDPELKQKWFNDTLETNKGKETFANRIHTMNLHENSQYDRKTPSQGVLDNIDANTVENFGQKVGGFLGVPVATTYDDASKEGINNPYEQNPFLSLGKDVVNTGLLVATPVVKGAKIAKGLIKGAGLGGAAAGENVSLGTEAEDSEHNPYLYSDKLKDIGIGSVLGSVMGLVSNLGGKIKEVPEKIKEFVNEPRALTWQGKIDQDVNNNVHNWSVNFADNLEKSANSYANDPVFLDANWQNKEDMIYKRAWEMSKAAKNAELAAQTGAQMKKEFASRNPFFPERTPVYSRIEHNVPYYIAGTNEDLATEVIPEIGKKMGKKIIPGAEKIPYYLQKQE